ncbi:MAG: response regulator transcription factor [Marmoricola sp.]|nr:response regulator transcription factor [Marmoricola sp.]
MLLSPPYTVVVVEDGHDLRTLWSLFLERDGRFDVVAEAEDGRAGVLAVRQHQPDLVLLDIDMPVMDGVQALALMRRHSPSSAVVMLSSLGRESARVAHALALGAHGYLRKGMSRTELLSRLETIARHRPGAHTQPARHQH